MTTEESMEATKYGGYPHEFNPTSIRRRRSPVASHGLRGEHIARCLGTANRGHWIGCFDHGTEPNDQAKPFAEFGNPLRHRARGLAITRQVAHEANSIPGDAIHTGYDAGWPWSADGAAVLCADRQEVCLMRGDKV